jgi:PncC family amidohydrolase
MSTSGDNPPSERLGQAAQTLGMWLLNSGREKVVFAESCTAGLVAAELATVPGISQHLCGSMVTYREPSKTAWLGVEVKVLQQFSAVSQQVTDALATGVLERTKEATWCAAITGHLGPGAPADLDGKVFIAVARREPNGGAGQIVKQLALRLRSSSRRDRQAEAAAAVLETIAGELQRASEN